MGAAERIAAAVHEGIDANSGVSVLSLMPKPELSGSRASIDADVGWA